MQKKVVAITHIGHVISNGLPHDTRAADYDDWNLNCDIIYYHEVLDIALEISSMGIRVNKQSLMKQLEISNETNKLSFEYHRMIINDILPQSIGGGIGQSRLSMLLLEKAHIGEVQVSAWDDDTIEKCHENKITIL